MTTLTFFGGAGSVTGVNVLVETGKHAFLFDCGLEQREDFFARSNSAPFAYDPSTIEALFVSHAHADHIGRIPKLVREGFHGTIFSTSATKELAELMFADSLHIMEDYMQGRDLLYEKHDVVKTMSLWETYEYHAPWNFADMRIEFLDAGHILGSALTKITRNNRALMFTGDLGNSPEPLLPDTEAPEGVHYLIMESVYGDRSHGDQHERREQLADAVHDVLAHKGTLLIPSFSIERTQIILHELNDLVESGKLEPIPVYLDSPLAIRVTEVFRRYKHLYNSEIRAHYECGDDPFDFNGLKLSVKSVESTHIYDAPNPKIVIAGSGMSQGGRVRSHERHVLPDPHSTILFSGYQVPGSLGRRILEGARSVEIDGERINVRARAAQLTGYSGHRDRDGLLQFVEGGSDFERVFVAMGEPKSALFLAQRIRDFLGIDAVVPEPERKYHIDW